ncbi:hypothetical protein J2S28_005733 [Rhizobium sp. SLBN-94]|nr:hypothetical protein [Rhizobium sp. SLBN-94]
MLLLEAVDDYVGPDNPVRFIEAFVDDLDLNAAGFVRVDDQGAFLIRGLDNVRAEFSLTALAYNIKRAITLVGVTGLIAAVRA